MEKISRRRLLRGGVVAAAAAPVLHEVIPHQRLHGQEAIANLATEELSHPAPVFHGDTLFAESEVLELKPSQSKPDRGVVRVHTRVFNQDGTLVAEFKRAVLVPRRTQD